MVETKVVKIRGQEFTIAELTIDEIAEWQKGMAAIQAGSGVTLSDVHNVSRKACIASLSAGGKTDPGIVGKLPPRALKVLSSEVLSFSNMLEDAPGEAKGSP
jgi:hypothetical protein